MKTLVIMQPHFFPWFGYFDLIKNSDIFVFLDNVTFPHRSFVNRVKFNIDNNISWVTLPLSRKNNQLINETFLFEKEKNFKKLKKKIFHSLHKNPHYEVLEDLLNQVVIDDIKTISEFNILTIKKISNYIFNRKINIYKSSDLNISKTKSSAVLETCETLKVTSYLTGDGGKNYLNFNDFEKKNIKVEFLNYSLKDYDEKKIKNLTILDIISRQGKKTNEFLNSQKVYWKDYIKIK